MAGNARSGFALIVVLFSLTVLALIFGTASTRTITHIQRTQTERLLAERFEERTALAELILLQEPQVLAEPGSQVRQLLQARGLVLQPATGLVDLNTASPALLQLLLESYNLPDETIRSALQGYRDWRREGRKLLRVSDFGRLAGLDLEALPDFYDFTTVFSGRTGIAAEQAPLELLRHLLETKENQQVLAEKLDPELVSQGSTTNLHFLEGSRSSGVLHLDGSRLRSMLLQVQ